MDVEKFAKMVKAAKPTQICTGFFNGLKTLCSHDKETWIIKNDLDTGVKVVFDKPRPSLTIFEKDMLFSVFFLKRKPRDYAGFHKCIYGKQFIESIKHITIISPRPTYEII